MTQVPPPPSRPAFRHLDVRRIVDGDRGLALVDPLGLVADPTFVPEGLLPVVGLFDGQRSVDDIHGQLAAQHDEPIPDGFVADLVAQLDERLLLASPRFEAALHDAARAFAGGATRPVSHAGSAGYPITGGALREAMDSVVRRPAAPLRTAPRGLIAPHIDMARGREGYSTSYSYLAECEPADLYVVFGTGHSGPGAPVTGLALDWETPFGVVPTDRGLIEAVHARIGAPDPLDVFLHKQEHSLEFQVVHLAHVHGERPFRVAGFLCGAMPSANGDPGGEDYARRLVDAFREVCAARDEKVCFLAGADLAHVGPYFGDPRAVDEALLADLEAAERERLALLEGGEPGRFHAAVTGPSPRRLDPGAAPEPNADRVCSATAIYLTAQLAGGDGLLLHYGQAASPDGSQVVSFCSMAFE